MKVLSARPQLGSTPGLLQLYNYTYSSAVFNYFAQVRTFETYERSHAALTSLILNKIDNDAGAL